MFFTSESPKQPSNPFLKHFSVKRFLFIQKIESSGLREKDIRKCFFITISCLCLSLLLSALFVSLFLYTGRRFNSCGDRLCYQRVGGVEG